MRRNTFVTAVIAFALGVALPRHLFTPAVGAIEGAVLQWQAERIPAGAIVFLGDSLTSMGDFSGVSSDKPTINAGVPGETVSKIANRAAAIAATAPSAIFVMAGINDFIGGADVQKVLSDYKSLLNNTANDRTHIFVQSTLLTAIPFQPTLNSRISELNNGLVRLCHGAKNCTFIDLNRIFAPGGVLLYPRDGLHLYPDAYEKWRAVIRQSLRSP